MLFWYAFSVLLPWNKLTTQRKHVLIYLNMLIVYIALIFSALEVIKTTEMDKAPLSNVDLFWFYTEIHLPKAKHSACWNMIHPSIDGEISTEVCHCREQHAVLDHYTLQATAQVLRKPFVAALPYFSYLNFLMHVIMVYHEIDHHIDRVKILFLKGPTV